MSPYPLDPIDATGPMRLVVTALPDGSEADRVVRGVLARRLAACAQVVRVDSRYWWRDRMEAAPERVVWFKTTPKLVGALFRYLADEHPYDVPEILEVDVARVHPAYLRYLAETLDPDSPPPPLGGGRVPPTRRRGAPRVREGRRPGRIPRPRRRRSTGTGSPP